MGQICNNFVVNAVSRVIADTFVNHLGLSFEQKEKALSYQVEGVRQVLPENLWSEVFAEVILCLTVFPWQMRDDFSLIKYLEPLDIQGENRGRYFVDIMSCCEKADYEGLNTIIRKMRLQRKA